MARWGREPGRVRGPARAGAAGARLDLGECGQGGVAGRGVRCRCEVPLGEVEGAGLTLDRLDDDGGEIIERLVKAAELQVFRDRLDVGALRGVLDAFDDGRVIHAGEDVAADEEVWNRLKRVLQTQTLEIQGREGPFVQGGPQAKPEAAPCDAKVIMIGADPLYDLLYERDPDFGKLFKVVAELDDTMQADDAAVRQYVAFVRKIAAEEELPPFDDGAVAVRL